MKNDMNPRDRKRKSKFDNRTMRGNRSFQHIDNAIIKKAKEAKR